MTAARVVLTYRDYAALPDDGRRYEVHEGELSVTPAPSPRHQETSLNLAVALRAHVTAGRLGKVFVAPIDVILSDTTVVQPDLVFVANDRLGSISARGIEGPPTLAVEILSPSTAPTDRHTKLQLYARHGVPHYWIVDPDAQVIEAYAISTGGYVLAARAGAAEPLRAEPFPDLSLATSAVWA